MNTKRIKYITHGKTHKQTINFDNGSVQVFYGVERVEESKWVHLFANDGRGKCHAIVNPTRVLFITITEDEPVESIGKDKDSKNK
jgi:hypothetical protein